MQYRKVWENTYGAIPKDDKGRSYDIHHIDGNRENNNISNLKAVSLEEHWKIHFDQGDYLESNMIAERLGKELYYGWNHKEETKIKIGLANKKHTGERIWINNGVNEKVIKIDENIPNEWKPGRLPLDESIKQKLRQANLGKKQSKETIEKRAKKNIGKKRSEETKIKQRESWTKERKSDYGKWISENRKGSNHPCFGKDPWNKGKKLKK
jgi:hypothetical protein